MGTKKLHVKTYGCQMNVYDSQRIADALAPLGFETCAAPEDADLVVLNTCHIREKAADKVYSELGRLRALKEARRRAGRPAMLAVAGCVAQAEGAEMLARAPFVDVVVGPQAYHRLPRLIVEAGRGGVVDTEFPADSKFDALPKPDPRRLRAGGASAFLTVQEGCDRFCTFCVVPYTRGAETSRPVAAVLAEARLLAAAGVCEIALLGQNVNAYHGAAPGGGEWGLARLIAALASIEGVRRIRYTTSHPADMDDALIAAHRDVPALMPFLHLPVQSGSDRVLKAMNRRHDRATYLRTVDRLRAARPDLALSSDFIVGFPGETEADFADTLSLVAAVGFVQAYSFKYSPRPGTPAAASPDQVAEPVKADRLARLQERLDANTRAFDEASVGRVMDVLFDRPGRLAGQLAGRSPYLQAVHAELDRAALGRIVPVRIEASGAKSLSAIAAPARPGLPAERHADGAP